MKTLTILLATTIQFFAWSQDWIESYKDASVSIEFSHISYDSPSDGVNHKRVIFKYSNLTNEEIELKFTRLLAYNSAELSNSPERKFSIKIPSNTTLQYSDEQKHNKLYYVFVSDNKGTINKKLSDFKILNVEFQLK